MARTINDIIEEGNAAQERLNELYTIITEEVNDDADLSGLTSTSKTAEFNLWKYIIAALAYIQESLWGEAKAEIQAIVDEAIPGTERWFQKEVLKFQYGDSLSFDLETAKYYYDVIDADNQIIKRCALSSSGGLTTIKVAKESGGSPIALTTPELNALKTYVNQIKFAGSNTQVISLSSDKLDGPMTVYYNGTIVLADLKALVEAAYTDYLANLPFNGEYSISKHMDAIQAVVNVNDVVMGVIQAKTDAGAYNPVTRVYYPASGYIERDSSIDFDDMITYVAQ